MYFLSVSLFWHTANFTFPHTVKHTECKCLCYLPTSFIRKYPFVSSLCVLSLLQKTWSRWLNINFYDTCSEYSIHFCSTFVPFHFARILLSWLNCHFPHSVQDSMFSRAFVIWYLVCNKSLVATHHTHAHAPCLILRRCNCLEAYSNYLNTLRTGDADLRFYVTTVQDGWCRFAF